MAECENMEGFIEFMIGSNHEKEARYVDFNLKNNGIILRMYSSNPQGH